MPPPRSLLSHRPLDVAFLTHFTVLLLAGCGGGGGGDSTGPGPPPPSTPPVISSTEVTYTGEMTADGETYLNAGDTLAVELTFSKSIANPATVQFLDGTTNLGGAIEATRNSSNTEHTATVCGTAFRDWVADLAGHEPVRDVTCGSCQE